jgi:hypothetical protein
MNEKDTIKDYENFIKHLNQDKETYQELYDNTDNEELKMAIKNLIDVRETPPGYQKNPKILEKFIIQYISELKNQ